MIKLIVISKKIKVLDAIQWLDSAVKLIKRKTIKACFSKAEFTYQDTNCTNKIEKMDEHTKESVNEMCSIVGENNTIDVLMIDKNLLTECEQIQ